MRILGVDPGSRITGFGVIDVQGNRLRHIAHGCIKTGKGELPERLHQLFSGLSAVIAEHRPDEGSIEDVFMARNAASALKLGQARGALIAACTHAGLPMYAYSPTAAKQAVVGFGRAEKQQMQHMVKLILGLRDVMIAEDAADALGQAICHAHHRPAQQRQIAV
ncbi:MAG: crossover junction endodeoxyribonuclease RuvC [Mariprofundaceae bacterium]